MSDRGVSMEYFSIIKGFAGMTLSTTILFDDPESSRHGYSKHHYTDRPIATFSYDSKTDKIEQVWPELIAEFPQDNEDPSVPLTKEEIADMEGSVERLRAKVLSNPESAEAFYRAKFLKDPEE